MNKPKPVLWSDFDGTAVEIASKIDPRNWSKYPLPAVKGYADFLGGVQASGVEIAGIVSRRPNLFLRRIATARSITKLGYGGFFSDPSKIVHAGSELAKGRFIAEQTAISPVGMLEDKPHNLGPLIAGAMIEAVLNPDEEHHPLLLGVVSHTRSSVYAEQMLHHIRVQRGDGIYVTEIKDARLDFATTGYRVQADNLDMHVAMLQPYSHEAGQNFGEALQQF